MILLYLNSLLAFNLLRAGVGLAYFIPQDLERTFARNAENERIKMLFGGLTHRRN